MKTKPVSCVKAHFAQVIAAVQRNAEPLVVTQNGASTVVIQDVEDCERTRKALMLLKLIALGEREIDRSGGISHEKLFATLRRRRRSAA